MVFHWSLSDSKSPQVSKTLLSNLADLNNVVVWLVPTRSLISRSSSPFINPSVTVPIFLFWHLRFLQSSNINLKKSLLKTYTLLMQYQNVDQILLSNSFDNCPNSLSSFFLTFFSGIINIILKFATLLIWLVNFFQKEMVLLVKKPYRWVGLDFEICLDRKYVLFVPSVPYGRRLRFRSKISFTPVNP